MNTSVRKRVAIALLLAVVLSVAIIRINSVNNVSFCHYSAGCRNEEPRGKITNRSYGFPLTYKQVQVFNPTNNDQNSPDYAGYSEVKVENLSVSVPSILMNIVFWFPLLFLLSRFVPLERRKQPVSEEPQA